MEAEKENENQDRSQEKANDIVKLNVWPTSNSPRNLDNRLVRETKDWVDVRREMLNEPEHGPSPALLAYLEYERDADAWDEEKIKSGSQPRMIDYATAYRTTITEMKREWREQEHIMKDPNWESQFPLKNIRKEMYPPYESKQSGTYFRTDD